MTDCDNTGLETLFDISTEDHKEATLTLTKESLKDLYGYLKLEINVCKNGLYFINLNNRNVFLDN